LYRIASTKHRKPGGFASVAAGAMLVDIVMWTFWTREGKSMTRRNFSCDPFRLFAVIFEVLNRAD
jgi:hypothetical protein